MFLLVTCLLFCLSLSYARQHLCLQQQTHCTEYTFKKNSKVLEDPQTALSTCSKLYAYLSDFMYKSMTELHVTVIIFLKETSFNSFIRIMH